MYGISYELEGAMNFVGSQVRFSACLFVCLSVSVCLCLLLSLSICLCLSASVYLFTARAREHITLNPEH